MQCRLYSTNQFVSLSVEYSWFFFFAKCTLVIHLTVLDQVNVVNIVNAVNTSECSIKCENDVQCARKKMVNININFFV